MSDLLDGAALTAHMELAEKLHQWASTAHRLVIERVDALLAVYPEDRPGGESARSWIERCHAHQHPFPEGSSIYSDLNCNTGYDYIEVALPNIVFTGTYPVYDRERDDFDLRIARIRVPASLMTARNGVEQYRQETAEMVAKLTAQRDAEEAELDALMQRLMEEHS